MESQSIQTIGPRPLECKLLSARNFLGTCLGWDTRIALFAFWLDRVGGEPGVAAVGAITGTGATLEPICTLLGGCLET
jgi:hypothetical protein